MSAKHANAATLAAARTLGTPNLEVLALSVGGAQAVELVPTDVSVIRVICFGRALAKH